MQPYVCKAAPHPEIFVVRAYNHNLPVEQQERAYNLFVERGLKPHLEEHHRHRERDARKSHRKPLAFGRQL